MPRRALSFGAVAAAYERFRPGYPAELADLVLAYSDGPLLSALEIGAGTGKATRLFARRGVLVTATDPDPAMLDELRRHVPATVTTVQAGLEDLAPGESAPGESYPLVYAAASLHWTSPNGRWERVAALLEPGGVFASFGGPVQPADPGVQRAVDAARAPFLDSDEVAPADRTPPGAGLRWPGTELDRSELFTDVRQVVLARRWTASAGEYLGHLSTISAYLQLQPAPREQALDAIGRVLPAEVELAADLTVHLARRQP